MEENYPYKDNVDRCSRCGESITWRQRIQAGGLMLAEYEEEDKDTQPGGWHFLFGVLVGTMLGVGVTVMFLT